MSDDIDFQELADGERAVRDLAAGNLELVYDDTAPTPELPPPGAPVTVVRAVRLPFDIDADVVALAKQRGVTLSEMLRDLIASGLEVTTGTAPDPVTELRRSLDAAQRAARELTADRHRDAA
ncbi:hypothetical protein [Dactylosporangium sp. NPDC049140]|uniref:hypothetical protein n=1 Tax=Dactylosporangium sp. NPDC049140 TaxID=3155647 RepID=UPI0033F88C92